MLRITLLVGMLTALPAQAVVLCARQKADGTFSSSVKIREACRTGEVLLDPVALGLQGPPGPQGEPGSGGPAVVYRDANGMTVGPLSSSFESCGQGGVIMQTGATLTQFAINADGTLPELPVPCVWFESADCSGQPLLQDATCAGSPINTIPAAGIVIRGTLYYPTGTRVLHTINSAVCGNAPGCQSPAGGTFDATPAGLLDVSQFTTPFHAAIQ